MHCMTNAVLEYHFYLKSPSTNCSAKEALCALIRFIAKSRSTLSLLMTLVDSGCLELELNMGCIRSVVTFASHYYYHFSRHALLKTA